MANGEIIALQLAEGIEVEYPAGSTLTLPDIVAPGTFGDGSNIPVVTIDAKGRVTAISTTPIVLPAINAMDVSYNNSFSGLTATDVQAAIDEIAGMVPSGFVPDTRQVIAGVGLGGGGQLDMDVTLNLEDTAVTPGTYGDATNVAQFTVDQQGRITAVTEVPISGGGGAVDSVNGQTGVVVLDAGDIGLDPTVTGQSTVQAGIDYVYGQIPDVSGLVPSSRTLDGVNGEVLINGSTMAVDLSMNITIGLADMPNTGDTVGGISNEVVGFSFDNKGRISNTSSTLIDNVNIDKIRGNNFAFAGFNGSGVGVSIPGWLYDATTGGLRANNLQAIVDSAGNITHQLYAEYNPTENALNAAYNHLQLQADIGTDAAGFSWDANQGALTMLNLIANAQGNASVGTVDFLKFGFQLGNGVDPISVHGFGYSYGFGNVNANCNITGPIQGYGFQPNVDASATMGPGATVTAFYDSATFACSLPEGYTTFNVATTMAEIPNNKNYAAFNVNPTITAFDGNAGVTIFGASGTYGDMGLSSNWNGLLVNPTISIGRSVYGIYVSLDNVTPYAGTQSTITEQDLTITFIAFGDNNAFTLEYVAGGTAGSEVATLTGQAIEVQIEDGVSTATQIKDAIEANVTLNANLTVTISGVGSNPQDAFGPTNFAGGTNPGQLRAAFFDGDVEITGDLTFGGALSIGQLTAVYMTEPVDGGGNPQNIHQLISMMNTDASTTVNNADAIGVNTAMLINLAANSVSNSGAFQLGFTALALPCVVQTHTGSTLDYMSGATYAINLDGASTGGTIDHVRMCRSVPIPNGITTVNNSYGYYFHELFGAISARNFAFYGEDAPSYFEVGLKIGGTAGTDDRPDMGYLLHVEGDTKLEGALAHVTGNVGFFGTTPVAQPTSPGSSTAGAVYTGIEQSMLQAVYDAVRALGLMA